MPGADNLVIQRGGILDLERLCGAIQSASLRDRCAPADGIQVEVIAELRACRPQTANPLDPSVHQLPSPEARSRLFNIGEGNVILHDEAIGTNANQPMSSMRLGADPVAVAIALSDELQINELDAAVLLFDARMSASHRPDHDVVAAAKELYALRRRQRVQYLQEVIRAALLTPSSAPQNEESFASLLMRERCSCGRPPSLHKSHHAAPRWISGGENKKHVDERSEGIVLRRVCRYLLLAETIFLLAYTVQLTSAEALALRKLVDMAETFLWNIVSKDRGHSKPGQFGFSVPSSQDAQLTWNSSSSDPVSREAVEAEGVCILLLLAWMSALDAKLQFALSVSKRVQNAYQYTIESCTFRYCAAGRASARTAMTKGAAEGGINVEIASDHDWHVLRCACALYLGTAALME